MSLGHAFSGKQNHVIDVDGNRPAHGV